MSRNTSNNKGAKPDSNLAGEVLRQAGKSAAEVASIEQIDSAEDEFEGTLDAKFRTENSPVHRSVWKRRRFGRGSHTPLNKFAPLPLPEGASATPAYLEVMARCVDIVSAHGAAGTLFDANEKVSEQVIDELSDAGYWGMLIDPEFGGQGALLQHFMPFLTELAAKGDPTIAGLSSIHGCIGAVDPLIGFGTEEQQARFLPKLASGEALSAFALTEPNAGSDLTALRTTAVLDGDEYVVNGRKLFISNVRPGRTIGLVCLIDGRHAVLIVDLPAEPNEHFQLDEYGIHAVRHIYNCGIVFNNFRVPAANLLQPEVGDGLTVAYHGLNRGRVALCANASGVMRTLLAAMLPWAAYRNTYGDKIGNRENVQKRIAHTASRIVGADALVAWCSSLLDQGYRGELECIIAKVFGSESLKDVAIEDALKTLGGRALLEGSIVGDNLHDLLAPMIYEGEGQMLSMALLKGLLKQPGTDYLAPTLAVLSGAGCDMRYLAKWRGAKTMAQVWKLVRNPLNLVKLGVAALPLLGWLATNELRFSDRQSVKSVHPKLRKHVKFALKHFTKISKEIERAMLKHQVGLADRQMRMTQLSLAVQQTVTMLCTAQYATTLGDEATVAAADILCQDLTRELAPAAETDAYYRDCVKLAELVTGKPERNGRPAVPGTFHQIDGVTAPSILRPYTNN